MVSTSLCGNTLSARGLEDTIHTLGTSSVPFLSALRMALRAVVAAAEWYLP